MMPVISKQNQIRKSLTILLLLIMFSAPLVLSWVLLNYTDIGKTGQGAASHGMLIQPPRPLSNTRLFDPTTAKYDHQLFGKWNLLYLTSDNCAETCMENLYKMRQIRLATGKFANRVQRILIVFGPDINILSDDLIKRYQGQLIATATMLDSRQPGSVFKLSADDDPLRAERLYVVDPNGNLMMSYDADTDPRGIIKDLERLLKYSRIG